MTREGNHEGDERRQYPSASDRPTDRLFLLLLPSHFPSPSRRIPCSSSRRPLAPITVPSAHRLSLSPPPRKLPPGTVRAPRICDNLHPTSISPRFQAQGCAWLRFFVTSASSRQHVRGTRAIRGMMRARERERARDPAIREARTMSLTASRLNVERSENGVKRR